MCAVAWRVITSFMRAAKRTRQHTRATTGTRHKRTLGYITDYAHVNNNNNGEHTFRYLFSLFVLADWHRSRHSHDQAVAHAANISSRTSRRPLRARAMCFA